MFRWVWGCAFAVSARGWGLLLARVERHDEEPDHHKASAEEAAPLLHSAERAHARRAPKARSRSAHRAPSTGGRCQEAAMRTRLFFGKGLSFLGFLNNTDF